ncbi:hypothetical protein BMS3Abin03_02774 [bacterium BMS3Abin03]|nr:hypothetical protein BMS3Abin03_02774 [bacterium BMS3Abin03]
MQLSIKIITAFLIFAFLTTAIYGVTKDTGKPVNENTAASLLTGLNSDNRGLKTSCAYFLGEFKVTKAIIPLMRILKNNKDEKIRIAAALALYKIGTPMSIFAVKQAGRFDDSERVRKLSSKFYYDYLINLDK